LQFLNFRRTLACEVSHGLGPCGMGFAHNCSYNIYPIIITIMKTYFSVCSWEWVKRDQRVMHGDLKETIGAFLGKRRKWSCHMMLRHGLLHWFTALWKIIFGFWVRGFSEFSFSVGCHVAPPSPLASSLLQLSMWMPINMQKCCVCVSNLSSSYHGSCLS